MGIREITTKIGRIIAILTDWFLILAGGILVVKAVIAVDVPVARYTIIVFGILLSGFGFWYRSRRQRRDR